MLTFEPNDFDDFDVFDLDYHLEWALKLLPGLHLETLTVFGCTHPHSNYETVGGLIQHGNGWKELHYITEDSDMLAWKGVDLPKEYGGAIRRQPQPGTWQKTLLSRDGADFEATVEIYQANEDKKVGLPFDQNNSCPLVQTVVPPETLETYGLKEDLKLKSSLFVKRELMVVVKRGKGADITERDKRPYLEDDIRNQTEGMTWPEIRRKYTKNEYDEISDWADL
jgi:hypothetical protein